MGYYAAGRFAALAGLSPICGNLLHHAVECFLKAKLARTISPNDLSARPFGHHLSNLWMQFRDGIDSLARLDHVFDELHAFENLRYPDMIIDTGARTSIVKKREQLRPVLPTSTLPDFRLVLEDIDELVVAILEFDNAEPSELAKIIPGFGAGEAVLIGVQGPAALLRENKYADRWRPAGS